jgi:dipeptidyl aminopeptidase/acylaminoacyl peptidase
MKRFVLCLALAAAAAHAADRWQPNDRLRLINVTDPQLSADGKTVLAILGHTNAKDNRYDNELVAIDVASGSTRSLTFDRRGLAAPRWSPDGNDVAFLANGANDKRQLWIMPLNGGDARRITDAPRGVQQFAWSPDGSQIAYVTADEPPKQHAGATGADEKPISFEVGDDDYLLRDEPTPSHIWLIPSKGGSARRVTSGTWSLPIAHPPGPAPSPLSWSPDGKSIAITRRESAHAGQTNAARIALVDVATGNVKRLTTSDKDEAHPVFSPDGTHIYYWFPRGGDRGNATAIWSVPASGGAPSEATSQLDHNVFRVIWMPDGKSFLTGAHDDAATTYFLVNTDGHIKRLDLGDVDPTHGFWPDASVSKNGAIAFTATTPTHPKELYVLDSIDAKPRQLTHLNDWVMTERTIGRNEVVRWKNDGFDLNGIVTYPPDFDASKKYPLVLYIHGGPRASSTNIFSSIPQSLAAHDWIVFQPNYRGSDNEGNAFTRAIVDDSGAGPGRDVMAGIELLKKRPYIDATRIGVGGWSYGGYMTSWMIGNYPATFRAAVSGAAVNNLVDQYVLGDNDRNRILTWGSPFKSAESIKRYIEQSPITYAYRIRTPTLIMSDTADVRVPVTQSYEMYRALRDNDVPTKFVAYPIPGHNPEDPLRAIDIEKQYVAWFAKWLGSGLENQLNGGAAER